MLSHVTTALSCNGRLYEQEQYHTYSQHVASKMYQKIVNSCLLWTSSHKLTPPDPWKRLELICNLFLFSLNILLYVLQLRGADNVWCWRCQSKHCLRFKNENVAGPLFEGWNFKFYFRTSFVICYFSFIFKCNKLHIFCGTVCSIMMKTCI